MNTNEQINGLLKELEEIKTIQVVLERKQTELQKKIHEIMHFKHENNNEVSRFFDVQWRKTTENETLIKVICSILTQRQPLSLAEIHDIIDTHHSDLWPTQVIDTKAYCLRKLKAASDAGKITSTFDKKSNRKYYFLAQ